MDDALVERVARHLEKEAFTLEALVTERRTLAADIRFEAKTAALTPIVSGEELVRSALVSEIRRQTKDRWPVFGSNDAALGLVDDTLNFDELAQAVVEALASIDVERS